MQHTCIDIHVVITKSATEARHHRHLPLSQYCSEFQLRVVIDLMRRQRQVQKVLLLWHWRFVLQPWPSDQKV